MTTRAALRGARGLTTVVLLLALAQAVASAQTNGGFEAGNLSSWTDDSGGFALVTSTPAFGFPSEGDWHLEVSAGDSVHGASHGPHQLPFANVVQVSYLFALPPGGNGELLIDWTFLHSEGIAAGVYNDFLSIDLVDPSSSSLLKNVVFVDTGTLAGSPAYTNVPGASQGELAQVGHASGPFEVLPTGFKRARVALNVSTPSGMARVAISVSNGGDMQLDSVALIDNLVIRRGQPNGGPVSLRLMSSESDDPAGSSSQTFEIGPYDLRVRPGQKLAFRMHADQGGMAMALLGGQVSRLGSSFPGLGLYNLLVSSTFVVFDGINPTSPSDLLLGTLNEGFSFVSAAVPVGTPAGSIAFQGIYTDPTQAPFFFGTTSATQLVVDDATQMPEAAVDLLTSGGGYLGQSASAPVDLTGLTGGGFPFYGSLWTQVHMNSHGNLTFGSGSPDGSQSAHDLYVGPPRIAPWWRGLNPMAMAGSMRAEVTSDVARFTWRVANAGEAERANHFTAELWADGSIVFAYECLAGTSGLVGIAPGGLPAPATPGPGTNLSFASGTAVASGPIYEDFGNFFAGPAFSRPSDVMTFRGVPRLTFVPAAGGGYRWYSGAR